MLLKFLIGVIDVENVDQYKKVFHLLILYVFIWWTTLKASSFPYKISKQTKPFEKLFHLLACGAVTSRTTEEDYQNL